jgi:hypothetical protein
MRLATIPTAPPESYADLLQDKGDPPRTTIIRRLGDPPPVVIAEIPVAREDPLFMYYSTFHWQSLVNGYSGFFPPGYDLRARTLNALPNPDALSLLTSLRVRYVLVHGELLDPREYRRITTELDGHGPAFTLISRRPWQGAEISLYRFSPRF